MIAPTKNKKRHRTYVDQGNVLTTQRRLAEYPEDQSKLQSWRTYRPPVVDWSNGAVNLDTIADRLNQEVRVPLCVAYGMGVDSTAMLMALAELYHKGHEWARPDIITFANTGSEKFQTYEYEPVINAFLDDVGFPQVTRVQYKPNPDRVKHGMYHTLEENCLVNQDYPGIAYPKSGGGKSKTCSQKWKVGPQDQYRKRWLPAIMAWDAGYRPIVLIGYDNGTNDQNRSHDLTDDQWYQYYYPLQELNWDRERCIEEIRKRGLPGWKDESGLEWIEEGGIPVKSACWFCSVQHVWELEWMAATEQGRDYLRRIVRMESTCNTGRHAEKYTFEGLWGNGIKGTKGGEKRPGRMSDYIRDQKLLGDDDDAYELPVLNQFNFPNAPETCFPCNQDCGSCGAG